MHDDLQAFWGLSPIVYSVHDSGRNSSLRKLHLLIKAALKRNRSHLQAPNSAPRAIPSQFSEEIPTPRNGNAPQCLKRRCSRDILRVVLSKSVWSFGGCNLACVEIEEDTFDKMWPGNSSLQASPFSLTKQLCPRHEGAVANYMGKNES